MIGLLLSLNRTVGFCGGLTGGEPEVVEARVEGGGAAVTLARLGLTRCDTDECVEILELTEATTLGGELG